MSVKIKTIENEFVLEPRVPENDGNADNSSKPFEQLAMFSESTKSTFVQKKNYKVLISVGTVAMELHPVDCVFSTSVGLDLNGEKCFRQGWNEIIEPCYALDSKCAALKSDCVFALVILLVKMSSYLVHVEYGIVRNLAVAVLLDESSRDRVFEVSFWQQVELVLRKQTAIISDARNTDLRRKAGQLQARREICPS